MKIELTEEENARAVLFAQESMEKAKQIEALFPRTTRGMLQFMYAIRILQEGYPNLVGRENITERISEWLAAGEPEVLTGIADKVLALMTERQSSSGRPN